jgi:biopolymer transport protein ExbB/TolQ
VYNVGSLSHWSFLFQKLIACCVLLFTFFQELAKSTLLRALQTERNSVDELEVIVASLQQNNSAISLMVESRDQIIEELNGRVAVFEEDKMVLKAALRQLQKEMKEEAPKTQKLVDELENSRTGKSTIVAKLLLFCQHVNS